MPSSLKANELSQWTHGNPDLIAKLLFNLFSFLQLETNEGKDLHLAYAKVAENISKFISLLGAQRLHIPQHGRAAVDTSALLGAYLRLGITLDGKPIVELSSEQIEAVHAFVNPLIPKGFTPKQFFEGLKGTPSQKHAAILKLLMFKDILPEHQKGMFKDKYVEKVNELIDSVLKLVDFMRTPFNILVLEEKASVGAAKKLKQKDPGTSGIDLQWTSMYKAIGQSLKNVITLKKGKAEEAEKFLEEIKPALNQCQQCFAVAIARYEAQKEFAVETQKREERFSETFKTLGFPEGDPEQISHYVNQFRQSLLVKEPERAEAIKAMALTQLISIYAAQWQSALDKTKKELATSRAELEKTSDTLREKATTLDTSEQRLKNIQQQNETLTRELSAANEKLEQQRIELVRLQKVESTSKETIEKLGREIGRTEIQVQEKSATLEKLNEQLKVVQKENEGLREKLSSAQEQEQTITSLKQQFEALSKENSLLRQQPEIGKHSTESSSEVPSEVTQLRSRLETLQQENAQLEEELRKAKQPLPKEAIVEPPKLSNFNGIKSDLLIALGKLRLNKADTFKIKERIIKSQDQDLSAVSIEIIHLQKINEFIETINNGILARAGFFSSDPHKKTKAIETAFQQLSIEDKNKLSTLSEGEISDELSKENGNESDIGKFLKAIHHKRGFIPVRGATSFTFFKSGINRLKDELDQIKAPTHVC